MSMIYLVDDMESTLQRILADDELEGLGLDEDKIRKTLVSFQGDEIAASVFLKKYALRDENNQIIELTLEEAKDRWAKAIVQAESLFLGDKKSTEYFRSLYNYFLPAGRQMFALGNDSVKNITYTNCYVTEIEDDSIEGIYEAAKKIAKTYSYGGGTGLCIGPLRPNKAVVSNSARQSSGSVSFMDLFSLTTGLIGQAGRRGALMITMPVSHPDVEEFINIKHNNEEKVKYANISLKINDDFMNAVIDNKTFKQEFTTKHETITKEIQARDLWKKIIQNARDSAEPGLMFWDHMKKMSPSEIYPRLRVSATNPCVTGDTLIYVADGRGSVPIKQLADEGNDVPVFCLDNSGKPTVRTMRNPRLTGHMMPVYKVTLDDGSVLRATGNHELYLINYSKKRVDELQPGDRLRTLTSYVASLEEELGKNGRKANYRWLTPGVGGKSVSEHRIVASFIENRKLSGKEIVHHKDYNGLNNNPSNLQVMLKKEHDQLHKKDMIGDKNPMRRAKTEWSKEKWDLYKENMSKAVSGSGNGRWKNISNELLKEHALILTKKLGVRFSNEDWKTYAKENNLVEQFSKWRNDHLNGVLGLAKWAALEMGFENIDLDPRTTKLYKKLLKEGYDCFIKNDRVWINKNCEICGKTYQIIASKRESGICSQECHSKYMTDRNRNSDIGKRAIDNMKLYYENKKKENAIKMVEVFLEIKRESGKLPLLKELQNECKQRKIPCRIGTPSFFESYEDLKEYADKYNHSVISVEIAGYEDVYNGTVDEFHNYCLGCWNGITPKGKNKIISIVSANCGEQILEPGGACVLGSLLLHTFVADPFTSQAIFDYDLFSQMVERSVRHLDNVIELNFGRHALNEQEEASKLGRRIGLGITGLADTFAALNIKYDSEEALNLVEKIMSTKKESEYKASIKLAEERGAFPLCEPDKHYDRGFCSTLPEEIKASGRIYGQRNVAISTVAPAGSLSVIAQCSSGIEPIFALNYKRYVNLGSDRKEFFIKHQGLSRFKSVTGSESLPEFWVTAHNINYRFRVALQSVIQKHTDASISSTINLPKYATVEDVEEIYMEAWKSHLKGITVYREGSREGVLVTDEFARQAGSPIDTIIYEARAEAGDKFYIPISYKDGDVRKPYQVFIINYKTSENDRFVKLGNDLVRMLKDKGVDPERLQKYLDRSSTQLTKLTRFLSLSMKTGFFEDAVKILNDHGTVGTLAAELYKILSRSLLIKTAICKNPNCGSSNVKMEEGCMLCLDCGWSGCG